MSWVWSLASLSRGSTTNQLNQNISCKFLENLRIISVTVQQVWLSLECLFQKCSLVSLADAEATRGWKSLDARITESLADMEMVVRHLNDITSYSMVNLERQVKNLELRHATATGPEEYSKFPVFMVSKKQNMDFYGREDELKRINHYLDPNGAQNLLRTYSKFAQYCFP
jgi:hypothetical protein